MQCGRCIRTLQLKDAISTTLRQVSTAHVICIHSQLRFEWSRCRDARRTARTAKPTAAALHTALHSYYPLHAPCPLKSELRSCLRHGTIPRLTPSIMRRNAFYDRVERLVIRHPILACVRWVAYAAGGFAHLASAQWTRRTVSEAKTPRKLLPP